MRFNKFYSLFFLVPLLGLGISNTVLAQDETANKDSEKVSYFEGIVNINTASVDELMSLKGIGKKRAEAIVEDRKVNGNFNSIEDLNRVKGFSKKIIDRIASQNEGRIQPKK